MKNFFLSLFILTLINAATAQLPEFQWAKAFVPSNQYNYSVYSNGRSVAVDELGNVYSAGLFNQTVDFDPGPGIFTLTADNWAKTATYISKLNAKGEFLWAIQIPTWVEFGNIDMKVDKDNNVYIVGELRLPTDFDPGFGVKILSPIGGWDVFIAKYNPSGNLIWAKQFGGPGDTVPRPDMLNIDKDNNIIICGNFNRTIDFDPGPAVYNLISTAHIQAFIVKLNSNGDFKWAKQFGNSPVVYSGSHIDDIKSDLQGNIYVTGSFSGSCDFDSGPGIYMLQSQGTTDGFVSKMDTDGNFIWAKSFGNTTQNKQQNIDARAIAIDVSHNVYIGGTFNGTFDFDPGINTHITTSADYDWYILKLNEQGDFVWQDTFGGSEADIVADIAIDNEGDIYATGIIGHVANMNPGPGIYNITTVNQYGASALVKLNSKGGFISAAAFDQINTNYGKCVATRMVVDNIQNIYTTGYIAGTVDFDPGPNIYPLSSSGESAPFVVKLAKCTNKTTATFNINTCSSFVLNNEIFYTSGTYIRTIPNSTGCDSIITLHLTISKKNTEQSKTICQGESFFAGGVNNIVSGIFRDTLVSSLDCDSIITTHLIVNPKPLPNLGSDRDLCSGTQTILNPGLFTKYNWQDNSTSNMLSVNSPGLYWVKVTNEFNCTANDSIIIKSILPSPNNFLKKTDSMCSYQSLEIAPTEIFNQYIWSTGNVNKQVIINKPGTYWLRVTDKNGCTGTNNIIIYLKDCIQGVYIPKAFTPNNDGHNDIFKALVFGKAIYFKLELFSREGKIIFQTTDPLKGWDGFYNGIRQSTITLVWQCSYQLENRQPEYQKGTVILLR